MTLAALITSALALLWAAGSPTAHPLTGTWVADLSSQQGLPTDVYVVRGGSYS